MEHMWAPWRMEYIENSLKEPNGCIFCEFPAEKEDKKNLILHRSDHCFVIMNKFPYNNGHLMVVPYEHIGNILQINDRTFADIHRTIQKTIKVLSDTIHPHGFNIGMNLGRVAGAGIADHVHYHIVPRWNGDTNYMPVIAGTKVVSESLEKTYERLFKHFRKST